MTIARAPYLVNLPGGRVIGQYSHGIPTPEFRWRDDVYWPASAGVVGPRALMRRGS